MKINKAQQAKLAGVISYKWLQATKSMLERGIKNPATMQTWVEAVGIHSLIPESWGADIEIGPRQAKSIINNAKAEAVQAIKYCDDYSIIRNHLAEMSKQNRNISGQYMPPKGYVIASWNPVHPRGFVSGYDNGLVRWTHDPNQAKVFPTKRGAKAKATFLTISGQYEGYLPVNCPSYKNLVKKLNNYTQYTINTQYESKSTIK